MSADRTSWNGDRSAVFPGSITSVGPNLALATEAAAALNAAEPPTDLASLSRLVRKMAHESNNLLGIVTLNLEEALETLPAGSDMRASLSIALKAAFESSDITLRLQASLRRM